MMPSTLRATAHHNSRGCSQAAEWERVSNEIDTAMIFAGPDFVKVRRTLRVAGACEFKYLVAWSG